MISFSKENVILLEVDLIIFLLCIVSGWQRDLKSGELCNANVNKILCLTPQNFLQCNHILNQLHQM